MKSDRCSGALKFEMAKLAEHLEYWTDISQKVMLAWEWANILAKIKEVYSRGGTDCIQSMADNSDSVIEQSN